MQRYNHSPGDISRRRMRSSPLTAGPKRRHVLPRPDPRMDRATRTGRWELNTIPLMVSCWIADRRAVRVRMAGLAERLIDETRHGCQPGDGPMLPIVPPI